MTSLNPVLTIGHQESVCIDCLGALANFDRRLEPVAESMRAGPLMNSVP